MENINKGYGSPLVDSIAVISIPSRWLVSPDNHFLKSRENLGPALNLQNENLIHGDWGQWFITCL